MLAFLFCFIRYYREHIQPHSGDKLEASFLYCFIRYFQFNSPIQQLVVPPDLFGHSYDNLVWIIHPKSFLKHSLIVNLNLDTFLSILVLCLFKNINLESPSLPLPSPHSLDVFWRMQSILKQKNKIS